MAAIPKKRNMLMQVLLMIVTCGLYSIYWFYVITEELKQITNDAEASPALWTVLIFVPFGAFYSYYKFGEIYEKASAEHFNLWLMFVLWLVFAPAVWFIVQMDMNKRADAAAAATPA